MSEAADEKHLIGRVPIALVRRDAAGAGQTCHLRLARAIFWPRMPTCAVSPPARRTVAMAIGEALVAGVLLEGTNELAHLRLTVEGFCAGCGERRSSRWHGEEKGRPR